MTISNPGWLTFDCYGTLVDWRTGMEEALSTVSAAHVGELLDAYHRHEPDLQELRPVLSYREVLRRGTEAAAAEVGVPLRPTDTTVLADTMPAWPPFPETAVTLERLRARGWRLGVLSNVDNDVLSQTLDLLGAPIDLAVTAEDVGSYKPRLAHFQRFEQLARPQPGGWIHVACSWRHDVEPAVRMGVPAVFINREAEQDRAFDVPLAVLPDLVELPDILDAHVSHTP